MADPYGSIPEVRRMRWIVRGALGWALLIFSRLVWLQVFQHDQLRERAESQQERDIEIAAPRGTVVDRRGERLVVSVPAYSLSVNPRRMDNPAEAASVLAGVLGMDGRKLQREIERARDRHRGFLWVKRKISHQEYEQLIAWRAARAKAPLRDRTEWMDFRLESRREYPHNELAAALLGGVDHEEKGNAGIELALQDELQGEPGYLRMLTDVRNRGVDALETVPPVPGKDVSLTIDAQLQFYCDRALAKAVTGNGCQNGTIVVMDPRSGEIYAMSSYPSFNPNIAPRSREDLARRLHLAVAQMMDPGSVFKMFVFAGALEATRLRPSTGINCGNGVFRFGDQSIGDTHAYSWLPMEEVLWHSSNVGSIHVGMALGRKRLYEYLHGFGFGQSTGVELPGELTGILRPESRWRNSSLYYMSIGHEVSVTTMQLAQACSVFANGGYRVKPKLVQWRQREGAARESTPESPRVRVIKAETAVDMRKMSEGVVLYGTGKAAKVEGFPVGGKTGTAQMVDKRTGRYTQLYSSSFMGYGPLHSPKVVVVVTLNGAKKYGGVVAAPVFSEVTAAALRILGEQPEQSTAPAQPPAADPAGADDAARKLAQAAPMEPPRPEPRNEYVTGPKVPDFRGMDMRRVLRSSAELGLPVEMSGTGLVRLQQPPAGSALARGEAIRLHFAR